MHPAAALTDVVSAPWRGREVLQVSVVSVGCEGMTDVTERMTVVGKGAVLSRHLCYTWGGLCHAVLSSAILCLSLVISSQGVVA